MGFGLGTVKVSEKVNLAHVGSPACTLLQPRFVKGTQNFVEENRAEDTHSILSTSDARSITLAIYGPPRTADAIPHPDDDNPLRRLGFGSGRNARKTTLYVVIRTRDRRWNWLGHMLNMKQHRVIRRVLMNCVRPTTDSIFGDVPDLDSRTEAEIAKDREILKSLRPSKRC